jgi:hypothetical protein
MHLGLLYAAATLAAFLRSYWLTKMRSESPLANSYFGAFFFSCTDIALPASAALYVSEMWYEPLFAH